MRELYNGYLCRGRDLYDKKYMILSEHVTV